jgi:spore maturation protein SpmA
LLIFFINQPKPKASPAKSNQAKAAAANTPSATPVPTQIVSPEQAAAVSKPTDAPTPQQVANAAAQATPNATPTISSQDNKAAAAAAVSKPTDNRNNEVCDQ